jgi:hypothetical protein
MEYEYQLIAPMLPSTEPTNVRRSDGWAIPFDPENTDYINFKIEINDKTATLKTVDGVLMTPDEAIAYVATLL